MTERGGEANEHRESRQFDLLGEKEKKKKQGLTRTIPQTIG